MEEAILARFPHFYNVFFYKENGYIQELNLDFKWNNKNSKLILAYIINIAYYESNHIIKYIEFDIFYNYLIRLLNKYPDYKYLCCKEIELFLASNAQKNNL